MKFPEHDVEMIVSDEHLICPIVGCQHTADIPDTSPETKTDETVEGEEPKGE